jgi:CheY-like chemotaxis protein
MLRVLVCDDAEPVRVTLTRALELTAGADVRSVASAEEALSVLVADRADPVDVVVMDQDLPGMAGYDAVRALRDEGIDVPVVLFTADRDLGPATADDPSVAYLCKAEVPIGQVVSAVTRLAAGGRSTATPE